MRGSADERARDLLLVASGLDDGAPRRRPRVRLAEIALASTSLEITRAETLPELARLGFNEAGNLIIDEHAGGDSAMEPSHQGMRTVTADTPTLREGHLACTALARPENLPTHARNLLGKETHYIMRGVLLQLLGEAQRCAS